LRSESRTDAAAQTCAPESLPASELIDYMAEHRSLDDFVRLGYILTQKLEQNFRSRPEDVVKAIRTFGDSGMVSRFNMIFNTMQPSDLGLLMPDLLKNYMMKYR
jgi:hypothetical protein